MKSLSSHSAGDCAQCRGAGYYTYDHNHSKPCEACCDHAGEWWPLTEHHAHGVGYEACRKGCGAVRKIGSTELKDTGWVAVWSGSR